MLPKKQIFFYFCLIMNSARCFWGPTSFSVPSYFLTWSLKPQIRLSSRNPKAMFCFVLFFFFFWRIRQEGKNYHSITGFVYRRWTEAYSQFPHDCLRWANALSPFLHYWVCIYAPKFSWYLKKKYLNFFLHHKFNARERFRSSRGPNIRKSQNF